MPRRVKSATVNFKSDKERARIERLAERAGLSVSNYLRKLAGLPPLGHGGKRVRKPAP
jgi:hypothetical protein